MTSPAAPAPFAVLVLAWDETTPAARVLVEATDLATSYADSVVALVPTGLLTNELSQEEFLPLESSPELPEPMAGPGELSAEALAESADAEAATDAPEAVEPAPPPLAEAGPLAPTNPADAPKPGAADTAAAATTAALVGPALVYQEVRVLPFGTYSPAALAASSAQVAPALVWAGPSGAPAAPYLGSSEVLPVAQGGRAAAEAAVAVALRAATDTAASALAALRAPGPLAAAEALPAGEESVSTPPAYLLAELPAAPDAEPDARPTPAAEPAPTTEASTTELGEAAASTKTALAVDVSPVQTAEPAAAAVPAGAPHPLAEPTPAENPELAALRPAAQAFDAPNLNFQIIQYARLAVPQALAEAPFGVIYAPAWPTWLAAQELRQRSGRPLVLHLAQVAAADDELIDLAAGWSAEIQRQALHRADLILTETAALAQRLRRELALPAHRVRAVPAADAAAVAQALRTAVRG